MIDISAFKPTFVYTIYIASTPDKVWQALTRAEFSRQYFSGFAVELQERVRGRFARAHVGGAQKAWNQAAGIMVAPTPKIENPRTEKAPDIRGLFRFE